MWTENAIEILRECEARVQGLVAEAAAASDYQVVVQLAKLARNIAAVAASVGNAHSGEATEVAAGGLRETATAPSSHVTSGRGGKSTRERGRRKTAGLQRKAKHLRSGYPKFIRVKDELVKIGWSKKQKSEYRHKSPRYVVDCLRDRIHSVGGRGQLVTTDDLFPLENEKGGVEIPTYQLYLCLAWFRREGLIRQEGRQGYRLHDPQGFGKAVEECWGSLSSDA